MNVRALVLATLLTVPMLAGTASAAEPTDPAWSPHNTLAATVNDIAISSAGNTIAAALGGPFGQAPNQAETDFRIYDFTGGPAYVAPYNPYAATGTTPAPAGRQYAAVNAAGNVVLALGDDGSPLPSGPTVKRLMLREYRIGEQERWSSASVPTVSEIMLPGTAGGLAVSSDGKRAVAAGIDGAGWYLRGYGADPRLTQAFSLTGSGTLVAIAASRDLSTIVVAANVVEGNTTRGSVSIVGFLDGRVLSTVHDRRAENTTFTAVAIKPDGSSFVAGGPNGTILSWASRAPAIDPAVTVLGGSAIGRLAYSADGMRLFAARGNDAVNLDATQTPPVARWTYTATGNVTRIAVNATAGLALVAVDGVGTIAFTDTNNTPLWTVTGSAQNVALDDAGTRAAVGQRGAVAAITIQREIFLDPGPQTPVNPIPATPDAPARITALARNNGAGPETLRFEPPADLDAALTVDPARIDLRPGEERAVTFLIRPNRPLTGERSFNITAVADTSGLRDNLTIAITPPRQVNLSLVYEGDVDLASVPGQSQSILIGLRNVGNSDAAVGLRVTQSVNRGPVWNVTFEPQSFTLAPNSVTSARIQITPPEDAPDGAADTLTITLEGANVTDTLRITLRINPTVGVSVDANARSRFVEPGKSVQYNVTVTNNGTLSRRYELIYDVTPSTPGKNWVADLPKDAFRLEPGANRTFAVIVFAPDDATTQDRATILVTARSFSESPNEAVVTDNVTLFANAAAVPTPPTEESPVDIPGPGPLVAALAFASAAIALRRRRTP